MDKTHALETIANRIWRYGETIGTGYGVLVPSDMVEFPTKFNTACDILIDKSGYTHFDRIWAEKDKTVLLKFYKGEALGACHITPEHYVAEYEVDVE